MDFNYTFAAGKRAWGGELRKGRQYKICASLFPFFLAVSCISCYDKSIKNLQSYLILGRKGLCQSFPVSYLLAAARTAAKKDPSISKLSRTEIYRKEKMLYDERRKCLWAKWQRDEAIRTACFGYSSTLLKLPVPKYVVFYNGAGGEPDQQELRLSESFIKQDEGSCLECKALILNINYGQNQELMNACRKLYEYSYFVEKVREYLNEGLTLNAAIDSGIQECIRSDILKPFLLKHRGEVKQVILTEYNEELHAKTLIEEGRREEREKNAQILQREREKNAQILQNNIKFLRQLLLQMLESKGRVSGEITERIHSEDNPAILQAWASFAVSCNSLEALEREILREEPRSSEGADGKQDS